MRFLAAAAALLLLNGVFGTVHAQGPDTTYVRIYQMIQEADGLRERGQLTAALQQYRDIRDQLVDFRKSHPNWHQNIIKYRLNYVDTRIAMLADQVEADVPAAPPSQPGLNELPPAQQLPRLREEIQKLQSQNALLQEKLKEALSAQPAAADPAELARALERVKELEKERDLLKVTLDTRETIPPLPEDPAVMEAEQGILERVQAELDDTRRLNAQLSDQNQSLQAELEELKKRDATQPVADSDLAQQLTAATTAVEELRSTNRSLRDQLAVLQTRIAEMTGDDSPQQQVRQLESKLESVRKERDMLAQNLEAAQRRLEQRDMEETVAELEEQLQQAQARLAVLEAEAVPLTEEELALVNQGAEHGVPMSAQTEATNATPKVAEIPAGAGPLIEEAKRAMDRGQFGLAEEKLRDVLSQDEDNVYTLTHLVAVLVQQEKTAEAEKLLQRALGVDPNNPSGLFLLGYMKYQRENYQQALDALSRSAQINPERADTQYFLGLTLLKNGNRASAETALRKAIKLQPNHVNAHYQLAVVYANQTPPFRELAQWHYQKAVDGGMPRNYDLEKLMEPPAEEAASATP